MEEDFRGDFRGDFKQDFEGDLLSSSSQLRSRSGLVQVWFSIELKFDSFELDSEVGRLVYCFNRCLQNINGLYQGTPVSIARYLFASFLRSSRVNLSSLSLSTPWNILFASSSVIK